MNSRKEQLGEPEDRQYGDLDELFYILPSFQHLNVAGRRFRVEEPRAAFMMMADQLIEARKRAAGSRPNSNGSQKPPYERSSCFLQHLETFVALWWNPNIKEPTALSKHFRGLVRDGVFETIDYSDDARRKAVRFTSFGKQCLRRLKETRRTAVRVLLDRLEVPLSAEAVLSDICEKHNRLRQEIADSRLYRTPVHRKRRPR